MDTRTPAVSANPGVLADSPTIQLQIAILLMPIKSSSRNTNEEAFPLVPSPEGASEYQLTRKRRGEESVNQDFVDQQPFKHRKKDSAEGSIGVETDEEESEYSSESEGETDLEESDYSSASDSEGLEDKARRYNEEASLCSRDSSRLRQEIPKVQEESDAYLREIIEMKRRLNLHESEISRWKLSCFEF